MFFVSILNFIKSLSIKDILYGCVIILLCFVIVKQCNNVNEIKDTYSNNITALYDTVSYYKTKTGDLVATKTAFETNIKELKKLNESLYTEIKDLKIKNEVLLGAHINGEIENPQNDTVYIVKSDTINKGFKYDFNFNNKWRTLEGNVLYKSDSLSINLLKDSYIFDYTLALDDKNNIYLSSSNPYVKYNEFSGFTIPKHKNKRFVFGPSITTGYDFINNKPSLNLGLSITYKFFEF